MFSRIDYKGTMLSALKKKKKTLTTSIRDGFKEKKSYKLASYPFFKVLLGGMISYDIYF